MTLKETIDKHGYVTPDGKIYVRCQSCGEMVRLNKPLIGSLHLCINDNNEKED